MSVVGIKKFRYRVESVPLLVWHFVYKLLSGRPGSGRLTVGLNNLTGLLNLNDSVILPPFSLDTPERRKCKEHHQHCSKELQTDLMRVFYCKLLQVYFKRYPSN